MEEKEEELKQINYVLKSHCRICGCRLGEEDFDDLCEDCNYEINQGNIKDPN